MLIYQVLSKENIETKNKKNIMSQFLFSYA